MHRFASFAIAGVAACAVAVHAAALANGTLLCGTAGDDLVAARAGLEREWVVQLPFDSAGWRLEHVTIGDGLVVAATGDGSVHAVATAATPGGPRPGSLLWSSRAGRSAGHVQPVGVGADVVAVANGLGVSTIDRVTGVERERIQGDHAQLRPAIQSGDYVYETSDLGGMRRVPLERAARPAAGAGIATRMASLAPEGEMVTHGGNVAGPPVPFADGVAWFDAAGRVMVSESVDGTWRTLEFDLGAPVVGEIIVRDRSIYAATERGDLVRLDEPEGGAVELVEAWHVVLPFRPAAGPMVSGDTVAISLGGDGIFAFAARTGAERWASCVAGRIVAFVGDRIWCIDEVGRLSGLDVTTGTPTAWLCRGSFTLPVVNTTTDRLILASPDGLLVSLGPRRTRAALPAASEPVATPPAEPVPAEGTGEEAAPAEPPEQVEQTGVPAVSGRGQA